MIYRAAENPVKRFFRRHGFCNLLLIGVNAVVFMVLAVIGNTEDAGFMLAHGAMYPLMVTEQGACYELFTSMFLHFGFLHLANNMLVLFFLGDTLERAAGHWKYLVIYLGGGLMGNAVSLAVSLYEGPSGYAVSAGASGAVFAVIGALLYIVLRHRGRMEDLSTGSLAAYIGLSLYHGFTGSGVDNFAHIGGLAGGFLLAVVLYRKKPRFNTSQQEERRPL